MTKTADVRAGEAPDEGEMFSRLTRELDGAAGVDDALRRIARAALGCLLCEAVTVTLHGFSDAPPPLTAGDHRLRHTITAPLTAAGVEFGVIEFGMPGERTEREAERLACSFARLASLVLWQLHEQEGLRRALEARTVIGQAQGILMERHGLDAQRAFQVLARHSQDGNVKLVEVSRGIVATRRQSG